MAQKNLLNTIFCKNRLLNSLTKIPPLGCLNCNERQFSTTPQVYHVMKLTRMRVVDNSAIGKQAMLEGKPPKIIQVYKKTGIGEIGDKVLVAIKGQKIKGFVVGVKRFQKHLIPRMDSNNLVLVDETGSPLGTRIHVPIPTMLRGRKDLTKLLAIATKFV